MLKRVIFFLLLVAVAGTAVWYFYFQSASKPTVVVNDPLQNGQPEIISRGQSISPVASHDGNKIWYGTTTGVLKRYELATGQETEYAGPKPPGQLVTNLYWPKVGDDLIFETQENTQKRYHYFNSKTQTYVTLPSQIISLDWLNDGIRIVYTWKGGDGKTQLVTANADGTGYRKVADVPWADLVPLASPNTNTAILYRPMAEGPINKIYLFNLETGQYEELTSEGWATGAVWSPNGEKAAIIFMEASENKLYLYDIVTRTENALNISANIGAIAFSQDSMYLYAISGRTVYKINLQTTEKTVYHEFPGSVNAKSVVVLGQEVFYLGFDGIIKSVK